MKKVKLAFIIVGIFFITEGFAFGNPCKEFKSTMSYYFKGNMAELGTFDLWASPNDTTYTNFYGSLQYYHGEFGSDLTATCKNNGDNTANVQINTAILGSAAGVLQITTSGPILHITQTSLEDHSGSYVNVSGYLTVSPNKTLKK